MNRDEAMNKLADGITPNALVEKQPGKGDTVKMLCGRVEDLDDSSVVKGSTRTACAECAAPVWLSPATQKAMADHADGVTFVPICVQCALGDSGLDLSEVRCLPGTNAEFLRHTGYAPALPKK
jgi:hypothetical protein